MQTNTTQAATAAPDEREQILDALGAFIRQRPGLEYGNYGNGPAYRSEMRAITKDRHQAETLLAAVRWRTSIGADCLKKALKRGFAGRLSWDSTKARLDYCTGQYFPTEYRKAVCAVLASALWAYWRKNNAESTGDSIRASARKEFGSSIAGRWFQ